MAGVNYQELQKAAKALNEACGTKIKVIGAKKDDLLADVKDAMDNGLDGIPESVTAFYNNVIVEETKFGNMLEDLKAVSGKLGLELDESKALGDLEKDLLEHIDALSDKAYDALDPDVQLWDAEMTKKINAEHEEKNDKKAEEVGDVPGIKKPDKKSSEKKVNGPRPDFKYSEGTSAHHIMNIFHDMFKKSKGEGIKLDDLKDAAVKAKVKSNNVPGRVGTVMQYATLPEGGTQVAKVDGLIYSKGSEPAEK